MKFDEEPLPLEAELPYLGPAEGVDPRVVLEDDDAHVRHSQVEWNTLVILQEFPSLSLSAQSKPERALSGPLSIYCMFLDPVCEV